MPNKDDLKAIARGLLPDGMLIESLTPRGKQEVRDAIDAVLRFTEPKFRNLLKTPETD